MILFTESKQAFYTLNNLKKYKQILKSIAVMLETEYGNETLL
jgi:hypothetical protein